MPYQEPTAANVTSTPMNEKEYVTEALCDNGGEVDGVVRQGHNIGRKRIVARSLMANSRLAEYRNGDRPLRYIKVYYGCRWLR